MTRVRPLSKATTPIDGESARGLVCRALADNGVPLSFTVLRRLGMRHRNVVTISESSDLDVEGLAKVIRVDHAELAARRYPSLDRGRLSFFGLEVPSSAIEKKVRRFSPAELGRSAHIRAEWEIKSLPFCSTSWEMLVDTCVCGIRQGWIRLNGVHRCDDCGRLLKDTPATTIPDKLRAGLSLVAGLASPFQDERDQSAGSLPAALRDVERSVLFNGIIRLSRARLAKGVDHEASTGLNALHAACQFTLSWRSDAASWLRLATPTPRNRDGSSVGPVVSAKPKVSRPTAVAIGERTFRRQERSEPFCPKLLGIRPAYELAKLSPETLLAARSRGLLGSHEGMRAGRAVPAFDPEEVVRFADVFRTQLSADSVAYRLGVGPRAVKDIASAGLIPPRGLALSEDEVCFLPEDVADFEARLEAAARPRLAGAIPLRDALRSIYGRPKPWAAIVSALLSGDLAFAKTSEASKPLAGILVPVGAARLLPKLPHTTPTLDASRIAHGEALEILNAYQSCPALDDLVVRGTNPRYYLLSDVIDLANRGISTLEASDMVGLSPARAYHLIRRSGISTVADGLWDRDELNRHIRNY